MRFEVARQAALLAGESKYFTGKPCKHGHITFRYTATAGCIVCCSARTVASRRKHIERSRATDRARYAKDPGRSQAKHAERRARKLSQACFCCTREQIAELYALATMLGDEVDHRVPLALGGLHCLSNLQVLTKAEHYLKTASDLAEIRRWRRLQ